MTFCAGKGWGKCVCGRINGSVHYSAASFSMITTNQKLCLIPNPCYCRLSLYLFLQIPNLTGVSERSWNRSQKGFLLSTGEPDNNSGSLGWGDGPHIDITPTEYPSTGELPWTLRKTGCVLHAWPSREIEKCLWHQLIFSPSSTSACASRARCFHCHHIDYTFPFPLHPVLFAYVAETFLRTEVLL